MNCSRKILSSLLLASSLGLISCGSASNDQGVSFTLLGFTVYGVDSVTNGPLCSVDKFDNTLAIPLGISSESPNSEVATIRCLLLQNNMTSVAVRTERANVSYYITGATEQPPSTTVPITVTVGTVSGTDAPAQGSSSATTSTTATTGATATKPAKGIATLGNRAAAPINMIPAEIRSWISLNRGSLPEAPFSMDIVVSVDAITTAGDQLESNKAYYQAQVVNDFIIDPNATAGASGVSGASADTGASGTTAG